MFGPIGGILGYYFTSRLEKISESAAEYGEDQSWNQGQRNSFLMSLLVISTAVIKADGKTSSEELSRLRHFIGRNFGEDAANEAESIVKYHPDKVATLGKDVQKAAEEKFKAVSLAYESICKERGI